MRPPTPHLHPDPGTGSGTGSSRLDRVWAETQPEAPPPEVLDALWAHASAELDRLAAAPAPAALPARGDRRLRSWVGSGLAAAAVLLLGVGLALRPWPAVGPASPVAPPLAVVEPASPSAVPTAAPAVVRPIIDVESDQTLVVRLDADGSRIDLFQPQPEPRLGSTALAENTARDVFNALEICATP